MELQSFKSEHITNNTSSDFIPLSGMTVLMLLIVEFNFTQLYSESFSLHWKKIALKWSNYWSLETIQSFTTKLRLFWLVVFVGCRFFKFRFDFMTTSCLLYTVSYLACTRSRALLPNKTPLMRFCGKVVRYGRTGKTLHM